MVQPARQQLGMVRQGRPALRSTARRSPVPLHRGNRPASLTMIVKNEEDNLSHCLESVRDIFDEIVVVDTGSTDRTIEIARSFGAKVFEFVWVDSFAAARNEACRTCDRRLCLLARCRRRGRCRTSERKLKAMLAAGSRSRTSRRHAYVVRCACDPSPTAPGARRSSTTSGCFPSATMSAGRTAFTSRSCPH